MFSVPSGLAPKGEKDNKVQAPGDDYIGSVVELIFLKNSNSINID